MSDVQSEHINNICGPAELHKQYEYIAAWSLGQLTILSS